MVTPMLVESRGVPACHRQLYNSSGQVIANMRYDPFGRTISQSGVGTSSYGFTGEQMDATGLVYLRARYYAPQQGRFVARDEWEGDYQQPLTLNKWTYVESNPANHTDSSGHGICLPFVGLTLGDVPENIPGLTVGIAIDQCRALFDENFIGYKLMGLDCSQFDQQAWTDPQTTRELYFDWLCNRGGEEHKHIYLQGTEPLTKELARSILVDGIRRTFYGNGNLPKQTLEFRPPQLLEASLDQIFAGLDIPITQFLGSFDYQVYQLPSGRVGYQIDNRTDRSSGTHFANRFPEGGYTQYLEDLVDENLVSRDEPLTTVLSPSSRYRVLSILRPKTRKELVGSEGGGNMAQTFVWTEQPLDCKQQGFPWPADVLFLDIRDWPDFAYYATQTPDTAL